MATSTTARTKRPSVSGSATTGSGPRLDVQGLRAVAVLAVIVNHLFAWPRGGFVGVDVFFVLSGFLITGLLVKERASTGGISFAAFYRRRFRRIVPAATATIVVTVVGAYALMSGARGRDVLGDGLWAMLFGANWHFASIGTDYFHNDSVSPLQHFWSLAVEEQFYVAWPLVILVTWRLARGHRRTWAVLAAAMGSLCALSFVYSMWHTSEQPTWAYFSTFDRAWELGVGAIIAVSRPLWERLPQLASWVVGWAGLAGIGASLFVVTEDAHFPAPWAALPVLSTAAVIAAGVARPQPYLFPIVNPVARYVGDLSYSLYLWHFPAVILLLAVWPDRGVAYYVVALLAMTGASLISFYMIEEPVRRSSFLEPGWWRSRARGHSGDVSTLQKAWLALAGVVVAVMVAVAVRTPAPPSNIIVPQLDASATDGQSLVDQQSERVVAALEAGTFPQFQPPLEDLGFDKWKSEVEKDGCTDVDLSVPQQCAFGPANAKTSVAVLGDSFAMAWMPTVRAAMGGSRIQQLTMQQCPAWDVPVHQDSGAAFPQCAEFRQGAIAWINANKPDVIMLTTSYGTAPRLDSGATGRDAANEGGEGLAATLAALKPSGARMVVVSPPPATGDLQECVTRLASPGDCVTEVDDTFELTSAAEKSAADSAGATYIPTLSWFCYAGRCPGFVGKTPVSTDGGHLTLEYAAELAPLLAEAVRSPEKS